MAGGAPRGVTLVAAVRDDILWDQLHREVKPGDALAITIEADLGSDADRLMNSLVAFQRLEGKVTRKPAATVT